MSDSCSNRHCGIAPDGTRVKDSAADSDSDSGVEDKLAGLRIETSDAADSTSMPEPSQRTAEENETLYVMSIHARARRGLIVSADSEKTTRKRSQRSPRQHDT